MFIFRCSGTILQIRASPAVPHTSSVRGSLAPAAPSHMGDGNFPATPPIQTGVEEVIALSSIPATARPISTTPLLISAATRLIPATMLPMPAAAPVPGRRASDFSEERGCHGTPAPAWPPRAGLAVPSSPRRATHRRAALLVILVAGEERVW
jgi:hypothetical protein